MQTANLDALERRTYFTAGDHGFFDLPRFMTYGLLIMLAAVAELPAGSGWAIATLLILAAGCAVLYRFVSDNPETGA